MHEHEYPFILEIVMKLIETSKKNRTDKFFLLHNCLNF